MDSPVLKSRKVDTQKVLLNIAKSMVRLQRPERLLKMITRYINKEFNTSHTSILVLREDRGHYIFVDSKGSTRIPPGLIKFEVDHPLAQWFQMNRRPRGLGGDFLSWSALASKSERASLRLPDVVRSQMEEVRKVMESLKVELVIPGYFKKVLLGFLLLGPRKDRRPFSNSEIRFFQILTQDCSMAFKNAEFHRRLTEKNRELEKRLREIEQMRTKEQSTYYEIVRSLAQEVYAKDADTYGHISQVERLGVLTARELGVDLSGRKKDILSAGLLLHDVGKIGIPDHVLNKPSRLSPEEWVIMKSHVEKGARILEPLSDFKEVIEIVCSHHENYDGSGYPRGLKEDEIPIEARIVAVVDAFHAIITNRCYCKGQSTDDAFRELRRCSGTQFDPQVVEAFICVMTKEAQRKKP